MASLFAIGLLAAAVGSWLGWMVVSRIGLRVSAARWLAAALFGGASAVLALNFGGDALAVPSSLRVPIVRIGAALLAIVAIGGVAALSRGGRSPR
jgi:hypothetical protein